MPMFIEVWTAWTTWTTSFHHPRLDLANWAGIAALGCVGSSHFSELVEHMPLPLIPIFHARLSGVDDMSQTHREHTLEPYFSI
jgi:hypothetical protein